VKENTLRAGGGRVTGRRGVCRRRVFSAPQARVAHQAAAATLLGIGAARCLIVFSAYKGGAAGELVGMVWRGHAAAGLRANLAALRLNSGCCGLTRYAHINACLAGVLSVPIEGGDARPACRRKNIAACAGIAFRCRYRGSFHHETRRAALKIYFWARDA